MKSSYVLITAARNEVDYISKTIESVINQTVLPEEWVIVSDGSTDQTDEIISYYAAKYNFIELLRLPEHSERDVGLRENTLTAGYAQLKGEKYELIGNLDADVSFSPDYYEMIRGGGGILIKGRDSKRLARAVIDVLETNNFYQDLCEKGCRNVQQNVDVRKNVQIFENEYLSLLENQNG